MSAPRLGGGRDLEEEGVWRARVAGSWLPPELWNLKGPQQEGGPGSWAPDTASAATGASAARGQESRVPPFCCYRLLWGCGYRRSLWERVLAPTLLPPLNFFLGGTVLFVGAGVAVPLSLLPFFPPAAGSAIMAGPGHGTALAVAVSVSSVFQSTHRLMYRSVISQRPGV